MTDATATEATAIEDTLERLRRAAAGHTTSVGDLLDAFQRRAYGPLLFVIGLIALSPVGAIPGASIACGTLVVLLAVQMSLGEGAPWVPQALRRVRVDGERARHSIDWAAPYARRLGKVTRARWEEVHDGRAIHVVVGALCVLALSMYPLALVPWGALPAAAGITVIGLGLLTRDGVLILAGEALAVAAAGLGFVLLPG